MDRQISLTINDEKITARVKTHWTLLQLLRDELRLTGTKEGCGQGECGSCTVLLDGKPVNSCLILAVDTDGRAILTIEGLAKGTQLDPLQDAFVNMGAIQCGYCTPGMVLTAKALLDKNPNPSEDEIRFALAGNLCRCTGYAKIVEAVQFASQKSNR